jgi:NADH-quinone oxidoreductase subunit G
MEEALEAARQGKVETAIILENDLGRRFAKKAVDEFLELCETVVVLDHLETAIMDRADIVIPVSTFAESDGTLINNEGRAQRFYKVMIPGEGIRESWRWLRDIAQGAGSAEARTWRTLDDCIQAVVQSQPRFDGIQRFAPTASYRTVGQKIPRESFRSSGRTAKHADICVHESKPPDDPDSPLAFTMEGYRGRYPSPLIHSYWKPGWNSVQALNKYQSEVGKSMRGGDSGIRLMEPMKNVQTHYFTEVPPAFIARESEWRVVPLHRIFGSEELSMYSPPTKELSSGIYVALNPTDAGRVHVGEGDEIRLTLDDSELVLPVRISQRIPEGIAGIPLVGPEIPGLGLPAWGKIWRQDK